MTNLSRRPHLIPRIEGHSGLSLVILAVLLVAPLLGKAAKIPDSFEAYATTDIGGGLSCVVGATSSGGEASNERAYVYLEESASHEVRWITPIPLDHGWYQNRASHCLAAGASIYALVQSDTNAVPVLSQTFVSVATLKLASGHIDANDMVKTSGKKGAHTIFVYEGAENFRFENGSIVVTGEWATKGDAAGTRTPFTSTVPVATSH
jgi:hypothetical protein